MKKFIFLLGLIAVALSLTNCTQEFDRNVATTMIQPFEIDTSTPQNRTINSGINTTWAEGDNLNVFHAETGTDTYIVDNIFTLKSVEEGSFLGSINGALTAVSYDWYAWYPYDSDLTSPNTDRYFYIGSKYNESQMQNGNNSTAHIAGTYCPLAGVAKGVDSNSTPVIAMKNVANLIEVEVVNKLAEPIIVTDVEFTAPTKIVGSFYVNFTDIDNITAKSSNSNYTSATATLKVNNGTAIDGNSSAKFYMSIAPFVAEAGSTLTLKIVATSSNGDEGSHEVCKTLDADRLFASGEIDRLKINYSTAFVAETLPSVSTESGAYIVGFEAEEGFVATTSYKVAEVRYTGAEGKQWGTVYGAPSTTTTGKISGNQSMRLYVYPSNGAWTEAYTFTNFTLTSVKELQFAATPDNSNNLKVSYKVAGSNWVDLPTFELSGAGNTYKYTFDSAIKDAQFKFTVVPTKEASGTSGKYVVIDDITFSNASIEASVVVTTKVATDTESSIGTTAKLNGAYDVVNGTGDEEVSCGFEYKLAEAKEYTSVTATSATTFSYVLEDLTTGSEYTYRAWASLDGGATKSYGEDVNFTPTAMSTEVQIYTLTDNDIKSIGASSYTDADVKTISAADGSVWSAYHAYKTSSTAYIAVKSDVADGYIATPVVSGKITKIVMNLKSAGANTKFTLSNGVSGEVFYTSAAMGKTTQDWSVEGDIPADCNQIAIRSASGTVTINSVTIYCE